MFFIYIYIYLHKDFFESGKTDKKAHLSQLFKYGFLNLRYQN